MHGCGMHERAREQDVSERSARERVSLRRAVNMRVRVVRARASVRHEWESEVLR